MKTGKVEYRQPLKDDMSDNEIVEIAEVIHSIFKNAFGMPTWTEEKIQRYLQTRPNLLLAYFENAPILYCTILLKNYKGLDDYLWIDTIAVNKNFQKQGLGEQTLTYLLKRYSDIKWIGARTQNPNIVKLMQKFCYPVFPLDISYEYEEAKEIFGFSRENIPECKVASEYGVCKNVYSEGRLGDYPNREELQEINRMFREIGCNRNDGDAAIIIGRIKNVAK
jgi:ribosomal protein S18 acetylase RimI-like enzyme